ncbi:hypothetical protein pdam_00025569, partial [Pocillopora damicornis]
LHFLSSGSGKYGGWAAASNNAEQYFQVDFGSWTQISAWLMIDLGKVSKVTRIATQGRSDAGWWSKSYSLDYTTEDGGEFTKYNNG